jgi:hypothetical protein
MLLLVVALVVLARGVRAVLRAIPLPAAVHLLVITVMVLDRTTRRRRALLAHATAAVLFVPSAQRLAAEHEVIILDDGERHPGLLRLILMSIKAVKAVKAAAAAAAAAAAGAAVAGCAVVAIAVHLDAAGVMVLMVLMVLMTDGVPTAGFLL